jgi:hypothetical protein
LTAFFCPAFFADGCSNVFTLPLPLMRRGDSVMSSDSASMVNVSSAICGAVAPLLAASTRRPASI